MSEDNGLIRFLVVDDDPGVLGFMQKCLSNAFEKASIDTAPDPVTALKLLAERNYSLVLSDCEMRPFGGFEFYDHAQTVKPGMPFVMISGKGQLEEILAPARQRNLQVVNKPFRMAELISVIQDYIPLPQGS